MSGYLQRLVAAAARPPSRMHPFVGSIFAPGPAEAGRVEPAIAVGDESAASALPPPTVLPEPSAPSMRSSEPPPNVARPPATPLSQAV